MKKLKIILQSNYFLITFIFLTLLYVICCLNFNIYHTCYDKHTKSITGTISSIRFDGDKVKLIIKAKEKIIANYYLKTKEEQNHFKLYNLGDKITLNGSITKPQTNTNFNMFNYQKYLLSQRIYWIFNASDIKLIKKNTNWLYKIKNIISLRIDSIGNGYLNTFIIGDNSYLDNDVLSSYRLNGISHLFALSGMHVSLITTCLLFFLTKLFKSRIICYTLISVFLLYYMFLTNFTPAIVRCSLFSIILFINNKWLKTINLFLYFSFVVLIHNPFNIYNSAFLFSYLVTLTLILLNKFISKNYNYFTKILIISFLSFMVSTPIMINNYHQINILGFIYNLFYVPFVSFIILPLTIISFIIPMFSKILVIFTNILETSSLFLSKLSFSTIILKHLPWYALSIYIIVIIVVLYKLSKGKYYYLILFILMIIVHANINYFDSSFKLVSLDVGQGDSLLISFPHNQGNILIDTGGKVSFKKENWRKRKKNYSIAIDTIIPYLKSSGIKKLNYLILTHGDYDHMGEAINLINNFKVEKVILNNDEFNELELDLIKKLKRKHIKYYKGISSIKINKTKLHFLNTKKYHDENDDSNVIYFRYHTKKFLLMGDAGIKKEKDILDKYNIGDIDVLKVGHHGSKTSSSKNFINEISPKYGVISVGKNNRYGHPNKEVLDTLKDSKIYRTDKDGSVMFKIKNNKLKIETCSP